MLKKFIAPVVLGGTLLVAVGGTASAARRIVERTGAHPVALTLFIELGFLKGRDLLKGMPVFSVLTY